MATRTNRLVITMLFRYVSEEIRDCDLLSSILIVVGRLAVGSSLANYDSYVSPTHLRTSYLRPHDREII